MEHLRIKDNNFGLFRVDTSKVKGSDKLEKVIESYSMIHPQEIKDCIEKNKAIRESRKNDYASTDKMRWGANLPVGLMVALEKVEPKLFSNKKLYHKFLNKFKGFRVCKKV